jgi:hypothetical protein
MSFHFLFLHILAKYTLTDNDDNRRTGCHFLLHDISNEAQINT